MLLAVSYLGDEPLRRRLEEGVNRQLKGYTASLGHAHLSLFDLSLTLRNVSVVQQANPEPPVIADPLLQASVHWKELLTLHLVADFRFDRPKLHVNRPQLLKKTDDACGSTGSRSPTASWGSWTAPGTRPTASTSRRPPMNDLLHACGRFDVTAGVFSFFSELTVRKGTVEGCVKPLFRDVRVYDPRQDSDKNLFRRLYEKVVGGVSKPLENSARDEVATKTRIGGPIENPRASVPEVLLRLVQNAFVQAILPGFDAELRRSGQRRPPPGKGKARSRHPSSGRR